MTLRAALARGFTLIEMAIVIVVIGLVLSGGLVAVAPVLQSSKISETNEKLDRIEQALILYTIRNGCLPCPADPGLDSTAANSKAGLADANAGTYYSSGCTTGTCASPGVVPWITLGLSETDATDGWGARIDYTVSSSSGLQNTNGMVRTPPSTYPAGALMVNNYSGTQQTLYAAYVLVSHGSDRFDAYMAQTGTRITSGPNSTSTTQLENGNTNTTFVQDVYYSVTGSGYFDDLVRWRTAPMIIQLCGTNACGNPA
jgi:prepilin-type N-terminal cleavage/methylation domain-containing protein